MHQFALVFCIRNFRGNFFIPRKKYRRPSDKYDTYEKSQKIPGKFSANSEKICGNFHSPTSEIAEPIMSKMCHFSPRINKAMMAVQIGPI